LLQKLKEVLNQLFPDHKALFVRLLKLLYRVSDFSDYNKMTAQNLAIVFGPNIFRAKDETPFSAIESSQLVNEITTIMIENAIYLTSENQ